MCPSYAESFGHPMVEAMASGRPIVAADRPTHREMCGPAAVYFDTFDPVALAGQLYRTLTDSALAERLARQGEDRAQQFSWERHFSELLTVLEHALPVRAARAA